MTSNDVFKVMSEVIRSITGVPVCVRANDRYQAPKGSYCSILVSEQVEPTAKGEKTRTTSADGLTITETVTVPVTYRITAEFYRDKALERATALTQCYRLSSVNDKLFLADLGWLGSENVINLTDLQSGAMEERASITINLVGSISHSEVVRTILSVDVNVQDGQGNDLEQLEISIPKDK